MDEPFEVQEFRRKHYRRVIGRGVVSVFLMYLMIVGERVQALGWVEAAEVNKMAWLLLAAAALNLAFILVEMFRYPAGISRLSTKHHWE